MNSFTASLHPLWIALLLALLSAPLFLLYLQVRQTRFGRRLRRRLLQRNWTPVFLRPYHPPDEWRDTSSGESK